MGHGSFTALHAVVSGLIPARVGIFNKKISMGLEGTVELNLIRSFLSKHTWVILQIPFQCM